MARGVGAVAGAAPGWGPCAGPACAVPWAPGSCRPGGWGGASPCGRLPGAPQACCPSGWPSGGSWRQGCVCPAVLPAGWPHACPHAPSPWNAPLAAGHPLPCLAPGAASSPGSWLLGQVWGHGAPLPWPQGLPGNPKVNPGGLQGPQDWQPAGWAPAEPYHSVGAPASLTPRPGALCPPETGEPHVRKGQGLPLAGRWVADGAWRVDSWTGTLRPQLLAATCWSRSARGCGPGAAAFWNLAGHAPPTACAPQCGLPCSVFPVPWGGRPQAAPTARCSLP